MHRVAQVVLASLKVFLTSTMAAKSIQSKYGVITQLRVN